MNTIFFFFLLLFLFFFFFFEYTKCRSRLEMFLAEVRVQSFGREK